MTVTVATLATRLRPWLSDEPFFDTAAEAMDSSETGLDATDGGRWAVGDILEYDDATGERNLVTAVATNTLTVVRGYDDSTATSHSTGVVLLKNPRFSYNSIVEALTRVVEGELWPYAYRVVTTSFTPSAASNFYGMSATYMGLVSASQQDGSGGLAVYGQKGTRLPVREHWELPPALSTSGIALSFPGGYANTTYPIYVAYRALVTTSSIEDGLMADVVSWGAASKLLAFADVSRTNQRIPEAETIPPGSTLRTAAWFESKFTSGRKLLEMQLRRRYPPMGRGGR